MPEFRITVSGKSGQRSWLAKYDSQAHAETELRRDGWSIVSVEECTARANDDGLPFHPEAIERHVQFRGESPRRKGGGGGHYGGGSNGDGLPDGYGGPESGGADFGGGAGDGGGGGGDGGSSG